MSIHHEVSIHCDDCGQWKYANGETTKQRDKAGWVRYKEGYSTRHRCPECSGARPDGSYWR